MRKGLTIHLCTAVLVTGLLGALSAPARAGHDGVGNFDGGFGAPGGFGSPQQEGTAVSLQAANDRGTAYVTSVINDAYAICANLPQKEYTVDCLGERLEALAQSMPNTGDYVEAKAVIADTSRQLRTLARQNRSTTKPVARLRNTVRGKTLTTSPVVPVATEAVESTIRQAAVIMQEAETRLLRSTASSDRRKVHYAQMAQAIGSNKILLRAI